MQIIASNIIPPCRPSFSEITTNCETNIEKQFDQHYWSHVLVLKTPCALCKRKSMSSSLFGNSRPSTMPSLDGTTKSVTCKYSLPDNSNSNTYGTSNGFQCLWCSRSYHRRCWNQIFHQNENNKCDYGILRYLVSFIQE